MTSLVQFVWSEDLANYNFGPQHPMAPIRLELTVRLARELGLFNWSSVDVVRPELLSDDLFALVHTLEYIDAVQQAADTAASHLEFGLVTDDVSVFRDMHTPSE